MIVKLREIVKSKKLVIQGFTVPKDIAVFFKDTYFKIEKSGNSIIFTSGCFFEPTTEQIKNYDFSDCEIR